MATMRAASAGGRRLQARRRLTGAPAAAALLCCAAGVFGFAARSAYVPQTVLGGGRRGFLAGAAAGAAAAAGTEQRTWAFAPSDLGMADSPASAVKQRKKSVNELQEALYLISRVQEATVQQERLVSTGKFKDMQRNSIKMALNMMLNNYKLGDQIVVASAYASPADNVFKASQAGKEAIDVLETAQEYFAKELKVSGLTDTQRSFIVDAMTATRTKLDNFLKFMPAETVQAARKQVEDENDANIKEYASEDGSPVINPVKLPWKS